MIGRSKPLASTLLIVLAILPFSAALWGQANSAHSAVPSNAESQSIQGHLELGHSVRQQITGGQTHVYVIALETGQFVRLAVSASDIAIVIRLFSPSGNEKLVELNLPQTQRQEPVCWVAKTSGEYRLEISASGQAPNTYQYEIKLEKLRPAAPDDQDRIAAQELFEQARGLTAKKEYEGAVEAQEKALALSRGVKDREREATALSGIGEAYDGLNQGDKAISDFEQALAVFREIKDRQGEGRALNNLGSTYDDLSKFEKAIGYYEQALAIKKELQDHRGEMHVLTCIIHEGLSGSRCVVKTGS
jgi:tetratricopeptide (TPR) repeat protein